MRKKIVKILDAIEQLDPTPQTYLKHIEGAGGLFEIRVQLVTDIFRIFCFFDEGEIGCVADRFPKEDPKDPAIGNQESGKTYAAILF